MKRITQQHRANIATLLINTTLQAFVQATIGTLENTFPSSELTKELSPWTLSATLAVGSLVVIYIIIFRLSFTQSRSCFLLAYQSLVYTFSPLSLYLWQTSHQKINKVSDFQLAGGCASFTSKSNRHVHLFICWKNCATQYNSSFQPLHSIFLYTADVLLNSIHRSKMIIDDDKAYLWVRKSTLSEVLSRITTLLFLTPDFTVVPACAITMNFERIPRYRNPLACICGYIKCMSQR